MVRRSASTAERLPITIVYAHSNLNYNVDLDSTIARSINVPVDGEITAFNQELRLSGKTADLTWMVGGNYDHSKTRQDNYYDLIDYSANVAIPGTAPIALALNNFNSKLSTKAAFANAEYQLTPHFSVNGGVRYTHNSETAVYCYNDPQNNPGHSTAAVFSILQRLFSGDPSLPDIQPGQCFPLGDGLNGTTFGVPTLDPLKRKLKEDNWSYRVGVNYKFDGGHLIYASISQGYKAGVFSNIGASSIEQYAPAKQEKVIAYEAGFKSSLADRRVNLSGAFFYYDYSDKQLRAKLQVPIFGVLEKMINVPKSYIWGLEGEISAQPVDGLTFVASATYLKSKVSGSYSQTPDGSRVFNTQGYTGDFKNSPLPFTPKFSANADIQYEWTMDNVRPFIGGGLSYTGKSNATFHNEVLKADLFDIPSYTLVDVRAGIGSEDDLWKLTLFGRNIFNKYYIVSPTFYHDAYFSMTGRPATYGVSVRLRFK